MKKTIKNIINKIKNNTTKLKDSKQKELKEIEKQELQNLRSRVEKLQENKSQNKYGLSFVFKAGGILAIVTYIGYLVFQSLDLVYMVLTAFIIALSMESMISLFERKMPRGLAIGLSYFIIGTFLLLGFIFIIPFVIGQSTEIIKMSIDSIKDLQVSLEQQGLEGLIRSRPFLHAYIKDFLVGLIDNKEINQAIMTELQRNISNLVSFGGSYISTTYNMAFNIAGGIFSAIWQTGAIFILSVFFSIDKDNITGFIGRISGSPELVKIRFKKLYKKLGFWLQSNFIRSIYVWITLSICLYSLSMFGIQIPHKGSLILMAGIAEFVPILGPIIGAIPSILVGFTSYGFGGMIVMLIIFGMIQWIENTILIPLIMNQKLGASSLLIFLAMFVGGQMLGAFGIILSVPIAVIVGFLFQDITQTSNIKENQKN